MLNAMYFISKENIWENKTEQTLHSQQKLKWEII